MNTLLYIVMIVIILGCINNHSTIQTPPVESNQSTNGIFSPRPIGLEKLGKTIEYINVSYAAISCSCAQWVLNPKPNQDLSESEQIYIEPANDSLINPNSDWDGKTLPYQFKLRGSFYTEKGYPENYYAKGDPRPARVFRYTYIKKL